MIINYFFILETIICCQNDKKYVNWQRLKLHDHEGNEMFFKKISRTISSEYRITMTLRRIHNLYSKQEYAKKHKNISIGHSSKYFFLKNFIFYAGIFFFEGQIYTLIVEKDND